jgi:hypothetical protein
MIIERVKVKGENISQKKTNLNRFLKIALANEFWSVQVRY